MVKELARFSIDLYRYSPCTFMQVDFNLIKNIFGKYYYEVAFRCLHTEDILEEYKIHPDDLDQKKFFTVLDPRGLTVCRLFSMNNPRDFEMKEIQALIQKIRQYQIPYHDELLTELQDLLQEKY